MDGDGIANGDDPDIDGDGVSNGNDDDMDGDGTSNGADGDMDGDNDSDDDVDGDGIGDGGDSDVDGDGTPNIEDPDIDGDGTLNEDDDAPGGGEGGCTTNCKGACCDEDTGACTLKKESGCGAGNQHFQGTGIGCSPNPCCAEGENSTFDADWATFEQVSPTEPLPDTLRGLAWPERLEFEISAVCDDVDWCAVLTSIHGYYSVQVDIAPAQQITGVGGNTTEATFCNQVLDLKNLGYALGLWYVEAAVYAHEYVHVDGFRTALRLVVPTVEQMVEAVCVPNEPGTTYADAVAALLLSGDLETVRDAAYATWITKINVIVDNDHHPGGPTDLAEHAVVDPMWQQFCSHSDNVCWAYCSSCSVRPEGACCDTSNGACYVKTECECNDWNGLYRGDGTLCDPGHPCLGACCQEPRVPPFPCFLESRDRCSGTFFGEGTVCTPYRCFPPGRPSDGQDETDSESENEELR